MKEIIRKMKPRSFYIESSLKLPQTIINYNLQVGGHGMQNTNKYQILSDHQGTLYKPIQYFPKGEKEILFYQKVFEANCKDPVIINLRKFLPEFRGIFSCDIPEKEDLYIAIEDLLKQYKVPSIADVKMGCVSYEPNAPAEKKKTEAAKYKYRESLGFLFTGFKLGQEDNIYLDRNYCRGLDEEGVYTQGIRRFLGKDNKRAEKLAIKFVIKLQQLLAWFESQSQMAFIASSILLAYESIPLEVEVPNHINNGQTNDTKDSKLLFENRNDEEQVLVKLIDFTHVLTDTGCRDENVMIGIRTLIDKFQRVYN